MTSMSSSSTADNNDDNDNNHEDFYVARIMVSRNSSSVIIPRALALKTSLAEPCNAVIYYEDNHICIKKLQVTRDGLID